MLVVIAALALSAGVGIGVYVVIKQQREASAADRATSIQDADEDEPTPPPAQPRAPVDPLPPEPVAHAGSDEPAAPTDRAEAEAVDPELSGGPPAANAPRFGTPGIDGALDKQAVATVVAATSPRLQKCFEQRYFKEEETIGGTLRVTLQINRRGGVTEATSAGVDDALGTCVVGVLKTVRFAKTADGNPAKIVYPIAFHNADGNDEGDEGDACDEVACVLANYEPACCAKFRRPSPTTASAPSAPDAPSREELGTALRTLRSKVAGCASAQGLTGTFKVRFKVLPSGTVSEVTVADAEPPFSACVARAFKSYKFSASQNGVVASFPFNVQ